MKYNTSLLLRCLLILTLSFYLVACNKDCGQGYSLQDVNAITITPLGSNGQPLPKSFYTRVYLISPVESEVTGLWKDQVEDPKGTIVFPGTNYPAFQLSSRYTTMRFVFFNNTRSDTVTVQYTLKDYYRSCDNTLKLAFSDLSHRSSNTDSISFRVWLTCKAQ